MHKWFTSLCIDLTSVKTWMSLQTLSENWVTAWDVHAALPLPHDIITTSDIKNKIQLNLYTWNKWWTGLSLKQRELGIDKSILNFSQKSLCETWIQEPGIYVPVCYF